MRCLSVCVKKRAPLRLQSRLKARGRTARPAHGCCVARAAAAGGFHGPRHRRHVAPRSGRRRLPRAAHRLLHRRRRLRRPLQRAPSWPHTTRCVRRSAAHRVLRLGLRTGATLPRAAAAGGCRGSRTRRRVAPRSGRRRLPRAAHPAPRCPAQRPPEASTGRPPGAAVPRAAAAGGRRGPRTRSRVAPRSGCRRLPRTRRRVAPRSGRRRLPRGAYIPGTALPRAAAPAGRAAAAAGGVGT